jgi:phage tail-like protein
MFSFPSGLNSDTATQPSFCFHVTIGANILGEFRAVKGVGHSFDAEEIREGGRNYSPHLRIGPGKYKECRIEWGISIRSTLFDWIHAVETGNGFKRLVNIFQLNAERQPVRVYTLWDAWPVSWEGANLDANSNELDTEEINIVYEFMTMVAMPTFATGSAPSGVAYQHDQIAGDEQDTTFGQTLTADAEEVVGFGDLRGNPGWGGETGFGESAPFAETVHVVESFEQEFESLGFGESDLPPGEAVGPFESVQVLPEGVGFDESEGVGSTPEDVTAHEVEMERSVFTAIDLVGSTAGTTARNAPGEAGERTLTTVSLGGGATVARSTSTTLSMGGGVSVVASSFDPIRVSEGLSFARTVFEPISSEDE